MVRQMRSSNLGWIPLTGRPGRTLADLDPSRAEEYYGVQGLVEQLSYTGNEAPRRYLDGQISADSAATWLTVYAVMERGRARQRVRFVDQYRSYVINHNLGRDLVARHIAAVAVKTGSARGGNSASSSRSRHRHPA